MTVHVGELTSQVEMTGVAPGGQQPGPPAPAPPGWAERRRFAELVEERERAAARTAAGGFDG